MKLIDLLAEIKMYETLGLPADSIIPLDAFVKSELDEADMMGATTSVLSPDELQKYLQRTASGKKQKIDKYKMPYVHSGNIQIKDENDKTFDLDKLKSAITTRPEKILKQNEKITHSGGGSTVYFNIGLPALKGLAVNEKTGDFVIVDTCPGAGACKVYCYAKKGGYVQWKASSLSQTKQLNFLLNDPAGYKAKLESEIRAEQSKYKDKNLSIDKKRRKVLLKVFKKDTVDDILKGKLDQGAIDSVIRNRNLSPLSTTDTKLVIRWHDAGDFFSDDYLDLAYSVAKDFPDVDFYAYTKMASVSKGSKPSNFKMNFSAGADPSQEKQINLQTTKHSTVVPKPMFADLVDRVEIPDPTFKFNPKKPDKKAKLIKKLIYKSPDAVKILKKKLALKYNMPEDSVITYDEMMKIPVGDKPKWNVIVKPGDGDDSANRADVVGTWLLIH
jgi:hypothetical protein